MCPDGMPLPSALIPGLCLSPFMPRTPCTSGVCRQLCLLQGEEETKPSLWGRAGWGSDAQCRICPSRGCLGLPAPGSAGRDVWAAPAHLCVRKEKIQTGDFLWGAEHRSISLCALKPKGHLENFFCQERS